MPLDLVREFLLREFFQGELASSLPDDQPLISSGLIDSVNTLKLVLYLEQQFTIEIDSVDIVDGKLDTLQSIAALIEDKRAISGS